MFRKARYVYSVYKEGSFTAASEKLYISQPCLSKAIKDIEDEIGGALFERNGHGVKPTELGVLYLKTAEDIIRLEDEFKGILQSDETLKGGSVRIGATHYMISYILPFVIDKLY